MNKEGKIWGSNVLLFSNNSVQINQIFIKKGGMCSKHKHSHKNNMFFVQSGKLLIEEWKESGIVDRTMLGPEQTTTIKNQNYHRFTALEDTNALEIYYLQIEENDIVREDTGRMIQ
jgi:mannose-6-phosphate isomerase-like protein (cupin superfamily)